jgi:mono/diheme cytochrome c family protein
VRTLLILAAMVVMGCVGGAIFVYSGLYNPAATVQHTAPVYRLLEVAMRQAVKRQARHIAVPRLHEPVLITRGLQLYREHCVQCHGAPGVAPDAFALGMLPLPANLALTAREWKDAAQLYWVIKYGIKMSGMPAWEFRMADRDLWAVVAFVTTLPGLSPRDYRAATESLKSSTETITDPAATAISHAGGDAVRGRVALQQYACSTCHVIPGIVGAVSPVGPSLAGIANRKYLAGMLPHTPESMVRWLRSPQAVAPGSAMPDLGVSERDARDIASYLETLR